MKKRFILMIILVISLSILNGCEEDKTNNSKALSPSVQDCIKREGNYKIITLSDGSQTGECILPDGTVCTDEQYYKTEEGCY